jgi:hypothetical protein
LTSLAKQSTKGVEHFASAMTITCYSIQSRPYFVVLWWRPSKPSPRRVAVYLDGRQGLSYFMSDRSQSCLDVHKLIVSLALQHPVCTLQH